MALVAQLIDIGNIHQARILRAMRSVASQASLRLYRCMLKHEWTTRLCVALGANHILICCGLQVVVAESAVWIVAIRATY